MLSKWITHGLPLCNKSIEGINFGKYAYSPQTIGGNKSTNDLLAAYSFFKVVIYINLISGGVSVTNLFMHMFSVQPMAHGNHVYKWWTLSCSFYQFYPLNCNKNPHGYLYILQVVFLVLCQLKWSRYAHCLYSINYVTGFANTSHILSQNWKPFNIIATFKYYP